MDTAREAAGIATVTDGRFELGIGAGHMKSEYDAAGIPFDAGGVRVSRLEESAELIRRVLDGDAVDFDGTHYRMHADAGALVAPPQQPTPMLIGGNGTRLLDSPFILLGTHEQMAEMLTNRQKRFGVSYWTVFDELPGRPSAMADIAKVIALLL